jgi:hypothetical protein
LTQNDPFGGDYDGHTRVSPFGDDPEDQPLAPAARVRAAARKARHLKGQVGVDGLPAPALRTLLDELSAALDAIADVLEAPAGGGDRSP